MKNKDIHKGLEKEELRTFFATCIEKYSFCKKKEYDNFISENVWESTIKRIEIDKYNLDLELERAIVFKSIGFLLKMLDWAEHGVSDGIEDYNEGNYFPFIGTEEEYKNLILKMKF